MLLHAQGISVAFGHLPLLDNAELRIESGERLALIGRNGTGKSTLLKVLSGEVLPDRGVVWREPGRRIARLDQEVLARVDGLTVSQEVAQALDSTVHTACARRCRSCRAMSWHQNSPSTTSQPDGMSPFSSGVFLSSA